MTTLRPHQRRPFKIAAVSLAVASCFLVATDTALANPTGGVVASGSATFSQQGSQLSITNTPGAVINWRAFSIGPNELTRFIQQSSASAVLNRVVGADPSAILGALQSNGRVFLINPNGILFGAGAQINVAGLVASTLNLSNADFAAGRLRFTDTPGAGKIINQGTITTPSGGQVYLVAPNVQNSGIITSPKGEVILAAGRTVELVDAGTPNLHVEITAPDTEVVNIGRIVASSGKIGIYAGLIKNSGEIRADGVVVGQNGEILLKATQNATLDSGSIVSASGAEGGRITVQSGDSTLVSGTVEAKGGEGRGGVVQLLGNQVALAGTSTVDASGQSGGGVVLVGGDTQGGNPNVQNAQFTSVERGAHLLADAGLNGDGGRVIVWSDDTTRFDGNITARGGSASGNGGFAEVSGKQHLALTGFADLRAPNGRAGTLLLDPGTVTICHLLSSCATTQSGMDKFSDDYISSQLGFGSLTITTASASTGPQDINFVDPSIAIRWSNSNALTLLAGNNIDQIGLISGGPGSDVVLIAKSGDLKLGGTVSVGSHAILRATAGAIIDGNGAANNITAQYLEAAAARGINLDTAIGGASPSYVNATNSTSGNIVLRNSTSTAVVQNIHNAGGNNVLSGLSTDADSTVVTGGIVIHGEWIVSGGQSYVSAANPQYTFTASSPNPIITLNSPRANILRTDPYLYLLDAGTLIASDDDSPQGYNSIINSPNPANQFQGYNVATLIPGRTYTVVAATYSSGQSYPFDLSIGGASTIVNVLPPAPASVPTAPTQQAAQQPASVPTAATQQAAQQAISPSIVAIDRSVAINAPADKDKPSEAPKKQEKDEKGIAQGLKAYCN